LTEDLQLYENDPAWVTRHHQTERGKVRAGVKGVAGLLLQESMDISDLDNNFNNSPINAG
jgi:hypothetical protein